MTRISLVATMLVIASIGSAYAGSFAQSITALNVRLGPGANYQSISEISKGTAVDVQRCHNRWCLIETAAHRGWVSRRYLSFGVDARGPLTGPKLNRVHYGSGTICFHTGNNFTGRKVCAKTGTVVHDLALYGYDNTFASISIDGKISAHVCRDFNFVSYCETISTDKPRLNTLLRNQISSYRVW